MVTTSLDGIWRLKALCPMRSSGIESGSEYDMSVPGSLHDTLIKEGLAGEPYDGEEIIRSRWIGASAWSLSHTFSIEKGNSRFFIKCGGLSASVITINGKEALRQNDGEAMLLDATELLEDGDNRLEIIFGKDGISTEFPGVWKSIKLLSDPDLIIAGSEAEPDYRDGKWRLSVVISAIAGKDTEAEYSVSVNGKTETGSLHIPEGSGEYAISIDPGTVSEWWPSGMGAQPIYPVSVSIGGYQSNRNVAFRTVSMLREGLFVNSRRIFMKGAAYSSDNLIPSRTSYAYIDRLTRSAGEANMNTLLMRTHAGRTLRDAAARSGLLVLEEKRTNAVPEALSAPSFPSKATLERIWKDGERNISSTAADLHGGGSGRILSGIADSFLFPAEERKLVYLSQIKAVETATQCAAKQRIKNGHGMILSRLSDPWPAISDSSIEYGGKWKLLQYAARSFFSPLAPMIVSDGKNISIYFVNDTLSKQEAEFSMKIRDFSGTKRETREYSAAADPGTLVKVADYPISRVDSSKMFVYVKMSTKDVLRERTLLLDTPKKLQLEDPRMKVETAKNGPRSFSVKLTVERPAFCTALESQVRGLFSDNVISVRPSAEKTVFFRADEDTTLEEFTAGLKVMDLYTAMH